MQNWFQIVNYFGKYVFLSFKVCYQFSALHNYCILQTNCFSFYMAVIFQILNMYESTIYCCDDIQIWIKIFNPIVVFNKSMYDKIYNCCVDKFQIICHSNIPLNTSIIITILSRWSYSKIFLFPKAVSYVSKFQYLLFIKICGTLRAQN